MQNSVTILIVEDNMIIGAKISMLLESLGYQVAGLIPKDYKISKDERLSWSFG